jgi:hypothetical protein
VRAHRAAGLGRQHHLVPASAAAQSLAEHPLSVPWGVHVGGVEGGDASTECDADHLVSEVLPHRVPEAVEVSGAERHGSERQPGHRQPAGTELHVLHQHPPWRRVHRCGAGGTISSDH